MKKAAGDSGGGAGLSEKRCTKNTFSDKIMCCINTLIIYNNYAGVAGGEGGELRNRKQISAKHCQKDAATTALWSMCGSLFQRIGAPLWHHVIRPLQWGLTQLLSNGCSLCRSRCNFKLLHHDVAVCHKLFALVFLQVEPPHLTCCYTCLQMRLNNKLNFEKLTITYCKLFSMNLCPQQQLTKQKAFTKYLGCHCPILAQLGWKKKINFI